MVNFWKIVNNVIREADILLLIIDSRFPELTRNKELELKIKTKEKKIIYVLNKCDLIHESEIKVINKEFQPSVFVSSKEKLGGTLLFKKIMQLSKGQPCIVGVLGYPNVGKSSVINLLKGRKSASVSSQAGHTRGIQFVKAKGKIKLIDTPGVLQFKEKDLMKQVIMGAFNPQHLKEPEYYAMLIIEKYPELFEKYYDVKHDDGYDFLEKAALKKNILKKGGHPDVSRFSRQVLYDWQKGKIHEKFIKE